MHSTEPPGSGSERSEVRGFSEAGICTREIEPWVKLLTGPGGWKQVWVGDIASATLQLWGLDDAGSGKECLLTKPGQPAGGIRLFQLNGVEQQTIRRRTHTWDSGGIFDLDIRVTEVQPFVPALQKLGWKGISDPIDWRFGEMEVREWLTRGDDDVILALIQRISPTLEGWDELAGFSHVFNSSQIVRDMDVAIDFYRALGFRVFVDHTGPLAGKGGEVLGLAPKMAPVTPIRLVIMHPQELLEGSVELVSFETPDHKGEDVSVRAKPWNLGLNLLRFPVDDLQSFILQVREAGFALAAGPLMAPLSPYGVAEFVAISTPDGAWLEFYQGRK